MKKNKLLIITWVSASGKTTLQNELMKQGWKKPNNFTTRKPRSEKEVDEYIFLNKERYMYLLEYWAFLEFTNGYWNWYAISATLPDNDICIVLDPNWREQVLQKMARIEHNYDIKCVYLDIDETLQEKRLTKRWDSKENIAIRKNDFKFFSPSSKSTILDWWENTNILTDKIINSWESLKKTL